LCVVVCTSSYFSSIVFSRLFFSFVCFMRRGLLIVEHDGSPREHKPSRWWKRKAHVTHICICLWSVSRGSCDMPSSTPVQTVSLWSVRYDFCAASKH
jgi:hypothetical protein